MSTPATAPDTIRTARLILRRWRDADLAPFAELNADPEVMAHMPTMYDRQTSDAIVALPPGDRLRPHVLYRLSRDQWRQARSG